MADTWDGWRVAPIVGSVVAGIAIIVLLAQNVAQGRRIDTLHADVSRVTEQLADMRRSQGLAALEGLATGVMEAPHSKAKAGKAEKAAKIKAAKARAAERSGNVAAPQERIAKAGKGRKTPR